MFAKVKLFKSTHSNEEGFTLIELMIVVVIIGILSAVALPIFANQQKASNDAVLKQDMKTTINMVTQWMTKGQPLASAEYVDVPFQYIIKYNNGSLSAWPKVSSVQPKMLFNGMTDFSISEGSRIAVKVSDPSLGFCVAGAKDGATYDSTSAGNQSDPNLMLFYDSATGKTTTRDQLTGTGACEYFAD